MTAWREYCAAWRLARQSDWPDTRFAAIVWLLVVHACVIFTATALGLCGAVR